MRRAYRSATIVSVNAGLPREVRWRGQTVRTSIFKEPVAGRLRIRRLNLDGDQQSDLEKHGGVEKAVYVYPSEHYAYWRKRLPGLDLPWGAFGENLTTRGLSEKTIHIGDRLRAGSAELIVTQLRVPCFKLGIRFGRADMLRLFLQSGRTGFYVSVAREGHVEVGDAVTVRTAKGALLKVSEMVEAFATRDVDQDLLARAASADHLPQTWSEYFLVRLASERNELSEKWREFFRNRPWGSEE